MLTRLQANIPYEFHHVKLLATALTHSSAANELGCEHNERLEFLGDAVLELCVSAELYARFPKAREGLLTAMRSRLVNQETLADIARRLRMDECLHLGKGEESQGGRDRASLLSDAVEALLGAVYLDGGFSSAQRVVNGLFRDLWPQSEEEKKSKDAKSRLQEVSQQVYRDRPLYTLLGSSGPEHAKRFEVRLELPDKTVFTASGSSVKRAEQTVAEQALALLGKESA